MGVPFGYREGEYKLPTPNAVDVRRDIEHRFTNHPPASEATSNKLDEVTAAFIEIALEIVALAPDSRERSLALTNLEQASMWTKAAIARHQQEG